MGGENGTSGYLVIASLYLNWNISVIHCPIDIKLILVKAESRWLLFRKRTFLRHFGSRIHDVTKFSIADISLIFRQIEPKFGQRVVHLTLRSYKICDLEGHLDPRGQGQSQCILFLYCSICRFIPPQILDWVNSNFQLMLLKKNFRLKRYYVINIFKLEYFLHLLSVWYQTYFGKRRMTMTFRS